MISPLKIHPITFIKAMSTALELSNTGISNHHFNTAIIGYHIATKMRLPQEQLQVLIYSSLLHDIGAASNWEEKHNIAIPNNNVDFYHHAEEGYLILKESPQLGMLAEPIRYHHDKYLGGNPSGLSGESIPLISRIIHLSDRIEIQIDKQIHIFDQRDQILKVINSSPLFDPNLVAVVNDLSDVENFWLDMINHEYKNKFLADLDFFGKLIFNDSDLIHIAEIFAKIVDATSHYTAAHSRNVAHVARLLSLKRGFCEAESVKFYLAGLLHDIGKLVVPNEILNKPDTLTAQEYNIIKQHPYYSFRILEQIDGFEQIASWVSHHHETFNEYGYPYKLKATDLDLGSRIIAVADVFSALSENRPYRQRVEPDALVLMMQDMVFQKRLDEGVVSDLVRHLDEFEALIQRDV